METEWEATFWPVEKDEVRARLAALGATLIYPERLMRRVNFYPPDMEYAGRARVRVRDEGDRITLSLKENNETGNMQEQKEVQLRVDNMDNAVLLLESLGCKKKNFQESRRELWKLNGAEVTIDEWPHLEPLVEVEGISEDHVRDVSTTLGFAWESAYFCAINFLYAKHYDIDSKVVSRDVPSLMFDQTNPFLTITHLGDKQ
jgi:adenylate cyclase class 2